MAAFTLVDDFESYASGTIASGVTSGTWTGIFDGTANAVIAGDSGSQALRFWGTGSGAGGWRGASVNLASSYSTDFSVAHGSGAGTYFFQIRNVGGNSDTVFGLSDIAVDNNNSWQQFTSTLSLTTAGQLRAWNGTGDEVIATIPTGDWVNVWIYADNAAKTFQVGWSTGTDDAAVHGTTFNFGRRNGADANVSYLAFVDLLGTTSATASEVDNIWFAAGQDFTNPIPEPAAATLGALGLLGLLRRRR